MPLDSTSSLQDVLAAYLDNVSYDVDGSVTAAREFIAACRMLLLKVPKRTAHGGREGTELEVDPQLVERQLADALRWLARNDTARRRPAVKYRSLETFRE